MRKLLFVLLSGVSALSFASTLDMSTLSCGTAKLSTTTTLADVQKSCVIKKQTTSKGRYEVKFINSATNKSVTCYFATNTPTANLNSCES
jgi:hypothetical protein